MNILLTGAGGFIGFHLAKLFLKENINFVGIDNLNNYYDVNLKESRLNILKKNSNFRFHQVDISKKDEIRQLFKENNFDIVINLAAQAGVRYSISNPHSYLDSNVIGTFNLLEEVKNLNIKHFIQASSSSVYGRADDFPLTEYSSTDCPVSLYAASKKTNEIMCHSYSSIHEMPITCLRFFTVYGPFGRPDMAYYKFAKLIDSGKPIDVFNKGNLERDFTYIDDITKSILKLLDKPPISDNFNARYNLFNIGNGEPVKLMRFIEILENQLDKKANINYMPMQKGDVFKTYADCSKLEKYIEFKPHTPLEVGLEEFIKWFKEHEK
ncbi:MAG: hypothetical protein CMQ70_00720 [Gammaproteobacteria bacterium]|nr:hypothetical protein [Gammaproteobacteria bacterium]|tara:strand:- start:1021 stop:1992 length:972 start_codon:yes stop_codon:yes gene_type:complete